MQVIITRIRQELKSNSDPKIRESSKRFFKGEIQCYGINAAGIKSLAKKYWAEVKEMNKKEIFALSEELLRSDMMEEAGLVILWLPKIKKHFERKDLAVFKRWIQKYINNWAKCDGFCNHTIGDFIDKFPDSIQEIKTWAHSKNRWMKRASAVSLILPARRGEYLADVFEIADVLLTDPDDMVQKGYGWMLKEASRKHEKEVLQYVMERKARMPRTALRYAIELMAPEMRSAAMKKI